MQYDVKLKQAVEEINLILEKYDCAGVVVLHRPQHAEYLLKLNPGYSCARQENGGIRIRAKKEDFVGREKERDKVLIDTSNMFRLLTDTTIQVLFPIHEVADKLDAVLQSEHSEGGHTSHDTQNN